MKEEDFLEDDEFNEENIKQLSENLNEEELEFFHELAGEILPEDKEDIEDLDLE